MGVTDIFNHKSADLSGIAEDLYVSDFVHKAKLSVDEKGGYKIFKFDASRHFLL